MRICLTLMLTVFLLLMTGMAAAASDVEKTAADLATQIKPQLPAGWSVRSRAASIYRH